MIRPYKYESSFRYRGLGRRAALLFSLLYAAALVLLPWISIRGEPFIDLVTYIEGFESGAYDYLDLLEGPAYLMSEPLWRTIVNSLNLFTGNIEDSLDLITFCVSTIYAYVLLRSDRTTVFFLSGPLLIDLLVSQIRSAVAGALFLIGCLTGSILIWLTLFLIATLIHSAAPFLFGLYALSVVLHRWNNVRRHVAGLAAVLLSIAIPLTVATAYVGLLTALGDRRVDDANAWPGGIFVLALAVYYGSLVINLRMTMSSPLMIFSLLMSAMFVVLGLLQINGLRFVSLTYPLLIVSALMLPLRYRLVVTNLLVFMCLYHFVLWI